MKLNTIKALILLLIILFSEGFYVRHRGKIHSRNSLHSKWKSHHQVVERGRKGTHRNRGNPPCQVGFNIKGTRLSKLVPEQIEKAINAIKAKLSEKKDNNEPKERGLIWTQIIDPIFKQLGKDYIDLAWGDFTGAEIASPELDNFLCKSIPIGEDQKVGVLAINIGGVIPVCAKGLFKACVMFDRCGTFGLVLDNSIITCSLTLSGIGAVVAVAANILKSASFAFSYHSKLAKKIKVFAFQEAKLEEKEVIMSGQLHIGLTIGLPLPDFKVGSKALSDIFSIETTAEMFFDFRKLLSSNQTKPETTNAANNDTGDSIINAIQESANSAKAANDNDKEEAKTIVGTKLAEKLKTNSKGMEFALRLKGKITLKLKDLTNGFLPDINITLPTIDMLITTGGSFGLDSGLYFRLELKNSDTVIDGIKSLFFHFNKLAPYLGYEQKIKDAFKDKFTEADVKLGFMLTTKGAGIFYSSSQLNMKCYYSFDKDVEKTDMGSCEFSGKIYDTAKVIFNALWYEGIFLFLKANKFYEEVGKPLFTSAKDFLVINTKPEDIKKFLMKFGAVVKDTASKVSEDVLSWFEKTEDKVTNWFSKKLKKLKEAKKQKKLLKKMRRFRRRMI